MTNLLASCLFVGSLLPLASCLLPPSSFLLRHLQVLCLTSSLENKVGSLRHPRPTFDPLHQLPDHHHLERQPAYPGHRATLLLGPFSTFQPIIIINAKHHHSHTMASLFARAIALSVTISMAAAVVAPPSGCECQLDSTPSHRASS